MRGFWQRYRSTRERCDLHTGTSKVTVMSHIEELREEIRKRFTAHSTPLVFAPIPSVAKTLVLDSLEETMIRVDADKITVE